MEVTVQVINTLSVATKTALMTLIVNGDFAGKTFIGQNTKEHSLSAVTKNSM
jgi:hypothetical protein